MLGRNAEIQKKCAERFEKMFNEDLNREVNEEILGEMEGGEERCGWHIEDTATI